MTGAVNVSHPVAAIDQENLQQVRDVPGRLPPLVDLRHDVLSIAVENRLQGGTRSGGEKYPVPVVCGCLAHVGRHIMAHHLGGIALGIEAEGDQANPGSELRMVLQIASDAVKDRRRHRTSFGELAAGIDEAQKDVAISHIVEQPGIVPVGVNHHTVDSVLDGWKLIGAGPRCQERGNIFAAGW